MMLIMLAAVGQLLQRQSVWEVRPEAAECVLSRHWEEGGDFELKRVATEKIGRAKLTFSKLLLTDAQSEKGYMLLTPNPRRIPVQWSYGSYSSGKAGSMSFIVNEDMWELLPQANALTIEGAGAPKTLMLDPVDWPMAKFADCESEVVSRWGVDRTAQINSSTLPLAMWMAKRAYPMSALRAHAQGRTIALIRFNRTGTAEKCDVVESAENAALDAATCQQLMLHAKIDVSSSVQRWTLLPVLWRLPD